MGLRATAVLLLLAAGCSEKKYFEICTRFTITLAGAAGEDRVDTMLTARGVDFLYAGSDMGCSPLCVSGPRSTLFRVRELLLVMEAEVVSWPADCFVPFVHSDQLGWEKGPWTKIARVRHRVMSTERVLDHLEGEGMATYFHFGRTIDLVFVKSTEAAQAIELLRGLSLPGVEPLP